MTNHFDIQFEQSVLDKGYVQVVDTMPNLEHYTDNGMSNLDQRIVASARVSFGNELKGYKKDRKLLRYLIEHKHTSPLEQVIYTFRIKAPLMVWGHIDRHRTARQNRKSYRYVAPEKEEFYIPDWWRVQSKSNKQASTDEGVNNADQHILSEALERHIDKSYYLYESALERGVAREQARLFLPSYALYQEGIWQMDLHNLIKFIMLRDEAGAQWETQQYAKAMKAAIQTFNPSVYEEIWSKK